MNTDIGVAEGQFWPSSFSLESYAKIWTTANLATGLVNSLIVAGFTAVASALLGTITAYVLVRYTFRGRLTILRGLVGLQSIPGTLMLLPVFVLFSSAGNYLGISVIGTRWGLFIAYLTFALPFSTWVMVTYLRGLPRELEEAAPDGRRVHPADPVPDHHSAQPARRSWCPGSSRSCWAGTTCCSRPC